MQFGHSSNFFQLLWVLCNNFWFQCFAKFLICSGLAKCALQSCPPVRPNFAPELADSVAVYVGVYARCACGINIHWFCSLTFSSQSHLHVLRPDTMRSRIVYTCRLWTEVHRFWCHQIKWFVFRMHVDVLCTQVTWFVTFLFIFFAACQTLSEFSRFPRGCFSWQVLVLRATSSLGVIVGQQSKLVRSELTTNDFPCIFCVGYKMHQNS